MSEQEILDVLECSNEFCDLSSDSNLSDDQDSLPTLVYSRKRPKPISDEETDDEEDSFAWKHAKQHNNRNKQAENAAPAADPFNFSSDEDDHGDEEDEEHNDQETEGISGEEKGREEEEEELEEDDDSYVPENQSSSSDENEKKDEEEESDEDDDNDCLDISGVSKLFKKKIKKFGISQRMAAKHILKCSQSNLSDLFSKACTKSSQDLTHRGKYLYMEMQKWLASEEWQKDTQKKCSQLRAYGARKSKTNAPKGKGKTEKFSPVQLAVLIKLYKKDNRPCGKKQQLIAETLDLELKQIRTWFNNQRARNFPAGREKSLDAIPDDLDSFVNNY